MLLEQGIPEHVIDHRHHMAELGAPSLVLLPACTYYHSFPLLESTADRAASCFDTELQSCEVVSLWTMFRCAWGRKLLANGTTTPHIPLQGLAYQPIPPHRGGQTPPHDPFGPYGKYPLAHYYPTAERARQWMEWKAMERARLGHEPWHDPVPW